MQNCNTSSTLRVLVVFLASAYASSFLGSNSLRGTKGAAADRRRLGISDCTGASYPTCSVNITSSFNVNGALIATVYADLVVDSDDTGPNYCCQACNQQLDPPCVAFNAYLDSIGDIEDCDGTLRLDMFSCDLFSSVTNMTNPRLGRSLAGIFSAAGPPLPSPLHKSLSQRTPRRRKPSRPSAPTTPTSTNSSATHYTSPSPAYPPSYPPAPHATLAPPTYPPTYLPTYPPPPSPSPSTAPKKLRHKH